MSGWKEYKLFDIASIENKRRIPLNSRQRAGMQGSYPYYGASGIVDYINDYIFDSQHVLISEDGENLRSRQTQIAFLVDGQFWVNNHAHILKGNDELINEFIAYCFQNLNINPFITGAVQPKLNLENLLSIPIFMPSREERLELTRLLDSLDRKISNLRQQNETLERIAQTLFKHWFVDFEFPNEDGKPYRSSGGEMVRSELGKVPVGWRVGKLSELTTVNPRESIKKGGFIKYVDMKSLSTSSMEITDFITREFTSGSKFRNFDTLLARITPCLENGKTAFVNILDKNEVAYGSTEFIVIRANANCCPEYVYCLSRSLHFRDYAIKNMTGSSGRQRVPNDRVEDYRLVIPTLSIVQSFHSICNSLFLKIKSNQQQIQTLTKTRDRLLPKLMSGKLRITEGSS